MLPVAGLLLLISLVPERRWGRAAWAPSALLSLSGVAMVLHLIPRMSGSGWGRGLELAFFAAVSVGYAYAAAMVAARGTRQGEVCQVPTPGA